MANFNLSDRLRSNKKLKKFSKKKPNFLWIGTIVVIGFFLLKLLGLALIAIGGKMIADDALNPPVLVSNQVQSPSPTPTLPPIPVTKILDNGSYHIFQSFNNCGPASLSMTLRFYGINESQEVIGNALRPYQIPDGDNDDKSVTLDEMAEYSKKFGLIPYHRPMGNPELVKQFLANDIPVIVRTWTKPTEDIGHYRVIKGYDNTAGTFLQDDSLQNKNLTYTYSDFNEIWKKFNYEYLVLVPKEKQALAERIMGENTNEKFAWQSAVDNSLNVLAQNPEDIYARFNLSVAYYHTGDYQKSVNEFEKVENQLPFRTLWYQTEPIEAYFKLGNYDRVFQLTDKILNNQNRAFSELYILRGKIYQSRGQTELARQEYQNAVYYNVNNNEAQELLNSI